jgi:hypothetical protein
MTHCSSSLSFGKSVAPLVSLDALAIPDVIFVVSAIGPGSRHVSSGHPLYKVLILMQTEKWLPGAEYDEAAFPRLALQRHTARFKAQQFR